MKTKNQIKGEFCETKVSEDLKSKCPILVSLKKGADLLCVDDKGDITFIEAKCNKSQLTDYQKEFKAKVEALGLKYEEKRCSCPEPE